MNTQHNAESSSPQDPGKTAGKRPSLSEHQLRLVTGLGLAVVLISAISAGGIPLHLLALLVSSLALWEFFSMYWPGKTFLARKLAGLGLGALVLSARLLDPAYTALAVLLAFVLIALAFLLNYGRGKAEARFEDYGPLISGLVYIPVALQLALGFTPPEQLLVVLAAILADIGGYYAGKHLGVRKIWPVVSPKKTWVGFFGGIVLCLLVLPLYALLGDLFAWTLPALPFWAWACLGVALCLAAQLGDFFESALKRSLAVKDSGSLLPGHGGLLDRIDSLLFVLPVYTLARLTVL